jgi:hypothetical protein
MKTFKDIIKEATLEQLPRRTKAFVDKHVVQKTDYPVDAEDQFTAKKLKKDKTKLASFHNGEDASVYEEVDLDEGVSNLSDARLKFHVLNNIPHGSYGKKEMSAEHLRRKKTGGPAYNAVKPSMNEEVDLDEAKTDIYHKHMLKALGKTRLPKDHGYTSSIANNGDFVVRKGSEVAGRIPKGEHDLKEASMSPTDMKQREDIVKGMKDKTQDFKDRYGSKWKSVMYATATKAAMKEEAEQIDELSKKTLGSYVKKAAGDLDFNARRDGKILAGQGKSTDKYFNKAYSRKRGIGLAADKLAKEEAEQIDEVSATTLSKYSTKAARQGDDRLAGQKMADEKIRKQQGKSSTAKVAAESVDLDEAFKAGAMKLNDGSSVTLTNESSNSLNNLFNQLSSSNKTKMEQRLMSGSKGFNEILAFAKEV